MAIRVALRKPLTDEEIAAKRFEANDIFTPSTPVAIAELFAGRISQASKIVDAIGERGRHVVLYGERGVGKSSIAQIIPYFVPTKVRKVRHIRVQAFPGDKFETIARKIFKSVHFDADYGEGIKAYNVSEFYPNEITADDFVMEMNNFSENEIPIIVIDEFNEIDDPYAAVITSNIIKALSDVGSNVTIIVVGVADNVDDLITTHESTERCIEQVQMPRMIPDERREVLEKRLSQLGMSITTDQKWKIINLSKGLPAYVHALGKHAVYNALSDRRIIIREQDVDQAISDVLQSSQQSLKSAYETATRSNQPGSLHRHILTACALAKGDDSGWFTPTAVREPLSSIYQRNIEIGNFQDRLKEFASPKRGDILERMGEARSYRYRFAKPAMQPYVIMRGIRDGIVDDAAKEALSSPEQPDLFANG